MQSTCRLWENALHCSATRGDNPSGLSARVPPLVRAARDLSAQDAPTVSEGIPGRGQTTHGTKDVPAGQALRLWG
jgi:hypothetical protein